jgi:hypothetical protein
MASPFSTPEFLPSSSMVMGLPADPNGGPATSALPLFDGDLSLCPAFFPGEPVLPPEAAGGGKLMENFGSANAGSLNVCFQSSSENLTLWLAAAEALPVNGADPESRAGSMAGSCFDGLSGTSSTDGPGALCGGLWALYEDFDSALNDVANMFGRGNESPVSVGDVCESFLEPLAESAAEPVNANGCDALKLAQSLAENLVSIEG